MTSFDDDGLQNADDDNTDDYGERRVVLQVKEAGTCTMRRLAFTMGQLIV
jgi:hypothetical protein